MGAKTWMLVYADEDARKALERKPELDREASRRLAEDIGQRLPFEEPFWATEHPAIISNEEKET
jgi:hypothetical protein